MSRLFPLPLLTVSLIILWMVINSFSPGHLLLGIVIAWIASQGMAALEPSIPRIRRIDVILKLICLVTYDILQSNIAVVGVILSSKKRKRTPGFVAIPLTLRDKNALAILACIITSTPGTAWIEYDSANGIVLIHVLDLVEREHWVNTITNRYEKRLMEIFE